MIISHRGLTRDGPTENTTGAVETALAANADGVEIDVRVSHDNVAVCFHDATLDRIAGIPRGVSKTDFRSLRQMRLQGGSQIAPLTDVLDLIRDRAVVVLDIKTEFGRRRDVAAATVESLNATGHPTDQIVISSFDSKAIDMIRVAMPRAATALLVQPAASLSEAVRLARRQGYAGVHPHTTSLAVLRMPARDLSTRVWTVNRPDQAQQLAEAGAAAVITDDPVAIRAAVAQGDLVPA